MSVRGVLAILRPHQYLKNGFVFLGVLFSHRWDAEIVGAAVLAFLAFCAMASAVYAFNDIIDAEADRAHPLKRNRPIASGAVSEKTAKWLSAGLAGAAVSLAGAVGVWAVAFVATYAVLNVLYSWRLKHVVILDVFLISAGFMLRIMAGTVGLDIPPSHWLLLCGLMLTLFLGFAKRRAELLMIEAASPGNHLGTRRVLEDYSPAMLEQFVAICAAGTILSYGLYTMSPDTVALHGSADLIYTLPLVVYGIFRYVYLVQHRNSGNDTARDLLTDRHLLLTVAAWATVTVALLY